MNIGTQMCLRDKHAPIQQPVHAEQLDDMRDIPYVAIRMARFVMETVARYDGNCMVISHFVAAIGMVARRLRGCCAGSVTVSVIGTGGNIQQRAARAAQARSSSSCQRRPRRVRWRIGELVGKIRRRPTGLQRARAVWRGVTVGVRSTGTCLLNVQLGHLSQLHAPR